MLHMQMYSIWRKRCSLGADTEDQCRGATQEGGFPGAWQPEQCETADANVAERQEC